MKYAILLIFIIQTFFAQAQGLNNWLGGNGFSYNKMGNGGFDNPITDAPPSYDPDAQALFDRMTTPPTDARKTLMNQLIVDLKAEGLWTKFVAFWVMASETEQAGTLNWINTSHTLIPTSSPTFTTDRGFTTNGSSNYIRTAVIPSSVAGYSQDDGSIGLYVNTNVSQNAVDMGVTSVAYVLLYSNLSSAFYSSMNDGGSTPSVAVTTAIGLSILNRVASANYKVYRDGTLKGTHVVVSTGEPTAEFYIGARNNGGSADRFASKRYAFAFVASGLTDLQAGTLSTLIINYLTAIGAQ